MRSKKERKYSARKWSIGPAGERRAVRTARPGRESRSKRIADESGELRGDSNTIADSCAVAVVRRWRRVLRIFKVGKSRRDRDRRGGGDHCSGRIPVWGDSNVEP
jgi:hypothetical protein